MNKELSIEEKAKRYDELKVTAPELEHDGCFDKITLFDLFPEFEESEDEKIRKKIIEAVKGDMVVGGTKDKQLALAWLEKQGEKNHADKVEPKFKVGDWVIDKQGIVHQIANVIENVTYHTYGYDIVGGGYFNDNTEGVRLWTIEDAKDGDVLANDHHILILRELGYSWADNGSPDSLYAYCGIKPNENFELEQKGYCFCGPLHTHPATKEQRDLLFQKMKDAGYTFDFEKKELKKIEQKPAWSEEDEAVLDALIRRLEGEDIYVSPHLAVKFLKSLKDRVPPQSKQEWSKEDEAGLGDAMWAIEQARTIAKDENDMGNLWYAEHWLKSLRHQKQWKPSDEQIEILDMVLTNESMDDNIARILRELREQLKKLK